MDRSFSANWCTSVISEFRVCESLPIAYVISATPTPTLLHTSHVAKHVALVTAAKVAVAVPHTDS